MRRLLVLVLFIALAMGAGAAWWLQAPMPVRAGAGESAAQPLELEIEPGTTPRGVAQAVVQAGFDTDARLLYWWFRLSGKDRGIKAGNYEIARGTSPYVLLEMLVRGEEALRAVTLVEGWNFRQLRAALARAEQLKGDTAGLSDAEIMARLDRAGVPAEGRFFPDTYTYAKGSSDLAVLRRALHAMDRRLEAAWALRAPDTPLKSPEQALILASIVEKETGRAEDRAQIAGVFSNRLRAG
ncbi:MAG: endolytic transglycosylase MltG, partial [Proteobacteria bacterium]|nr:endolytic transglycosylase MltG [Pseudomonadota bacterium]